jgi:hypothetical protein
LRLVDLASGLDRLSFATGNSFVGATPLSNGALLFVELTPSGTSQLRYLSASSPGSVLLGEWKTGGVMLEGWPSMPPKLHYPVDPTGCFTLVSTDLPPGPGTRLVVLPEQP